MLIWSVIFVIHTQAYVQQLETSRLKLMQLELEIEKTKKQVT